MAQVNIPYSEAGMASYELGDTYGSVEIFSGSTPLPVTEDFPVAAGVAIPAFSVVGISAGNLVLALKDDVTPANNIVPVGITTAAVLNTGAAQRVAIYRAGCFNPAALNWPASYDTDAEKAAAFRDAPTPTNILIRSFL